MDSYAFTIKLIENKTILELEEFMEQVFKAVLADDLTQERFKSVIEDFKSFEGHNHEFCVNFTGAWLKYALNGIYDKRKMMSGNIVTDILGDRFQEKERCPDVRTPQISNEIYRKINWISNLETVIEDHNPQRKYILQKCKKLQVSNNSWQPINIILLRPKDFLEVITSSKCVSEYRKYFIALAEIQRSYNETYVPWIRKYQKQCISRLEQKMDKQTAMIDKQTKTINIQSNHIQELLVNSKHLITAVEDNQVVITKLNVTVEDNQVEISKLHTKIDTLFEFLLSFARIVIPVMVGSSVIKQQLDTLTKNKDVGYALKHLKVLFMIGFFDTFETPVRQTKIVDNQEFLFTGRGQLKVYACCTNFADIGPRIRKLHQKYSQPDAIMYMLKPKAISLISCEINLERIILENSKLFPKKSIVAWDSRYKCYTVTIATARYRNAQSIFNTICDNASNERFQGYQMRIDEYNNTDNIKVDPKITNYINKVDSEFFTATAPFCQSYIDCYTIQAFDEDNQFVEYEYGTPNRKCKRRADLDNANLSATGYCLNKIQVAITDHNSKDHIQHMTETGIISKEDIPALKALAKFDNIDLSELEIPEDF